MVTDVSPLHHPKAVYPIVVTPSGIMIDSRLEQSENASFPMLFTLIGMSIDARLLHDLNA